MSRVLFLVRTPFQAFLCLKIIDQESIENYDVVYVSRHRNRKDEHYFRRLAVNATHATSLKRLGSKVDLLRKLPAWALRRRYDRIVISTLSAWYFRAIVGWHREAEICTFDDGAANYMKIKEHESRLDRIVGVALGGVTPAHIIEHSVRHYAVRGDLENIVPSEKIVNLEMNGYSGCGVAPLTILIGQNYHEYLSDAAQTRLWEHLRTVGGLYYPHPRETQRDVGLPRIDSEMILEDYVTTMSKSHKITLIGGFSTAFITTFGVGKIYIDVDGDECRSAFMKSVGCETVRLV